MKTCREVVAGLTGGKRGLQSKAGQMTGETFWVVSLQHHARQANLSG